MERFIIGPSRSNGPRQAHDLTTQFRLRSFYFVLYWLAPLEFCHCSSLAFAIELVLLFLSLVLINLSLLIELCRFVLYCFLSNAKIENSRSVHVSESRIFVVTDYGFLKLYYRSASTSAGALRFRRNT